MSSCRWPEAGVSARERRSRALELLAYVGLEHRATHRATQLSGGEMQRVAIARALANRPALLLADEPTGELDAATGEEILTLFRRLNQDGPTVTHDDQLSPMMIHMLDGRIQAWTSSAPHARRPGCDQPRWPSAISRFGSFDRSFSSWASPWVWAS